jgi:nitroimidazol reductase NimA-like FMN-containing flavoprotein (pyridoxamine 5'-phosphate oxidase superfamily)
MLENDAFRILDRRECLRLLAKVPVGRVVYTRQALPAVLPVNFFLDEDASVLLHTSAASDLVRAIDGVVVAFEADEFTAETRSGWSVVVTGRAGVVNSSAEHARLSRTGPPSWMPVRDGVFVRIESELVTGREIMGTRTTG